jgi:uncharacterized protein
MLAKLVLTALLPLLLAGSFGDRFIYYPAPYPVGDWQPEKRLGLKFEDRALRSKDGTKLHAWWVPRENARATVLFLHGNGGNVTNCAGAVSRLVEKLSVQALIVDYRGYGRSEGRPSEQGLYEDAEAAYEELTERMGILPEKLIIYGHSLGTAVATELALRRRAAGLILEAPFTSIREMVQRAVPFLDPAELVSERYATEEKIARLERPLLVVHGTRDRTIPIDMGRRVFKAAPEPKRWLEVEGAGHVDCSVRGDDVFYDAVRGLVDEALGMKQEAPTLY